MWERRFLFLGSFIGLGLIVGGCIVPLIPETKTNITLPLGMGIESPLAIPLIGLFLFCFCMLLLNSKEKEKEEERKFKQVTIVTTPVKTTEKPFKSEAKKEALRKIREVLEIALYEIDNLKMRVEIESSQRMVYDLDAFVDRLPRVGKDIIRVANMQQEFISQKNYTYLINLTKITSDMIQTSKDKEQFSAERMNGFVDRFKRNAKRIISEIDKSEW